MKKDATLSMCFDTRDVDPCRQKKSPIFLHSSRIIRNFAVSRYYCGTDAASPIAGRFCIQSLFKVNNLTAPCLVCGNAPGSFAIITLTTRSAVSFCQKIIVMKSIIISDAHGIKCITLAEKGGTL